MTEKIIITESFVPRGTKLYTEDTMKKNLRYLWIYTGILFSVALLLIIFAYFTQSNIINETKQIQETNLSGMQKSVTQLTADNQKLISENEKLSKTVTEQTHIIENYKEKETESILTRELDEKLAMAYDSYVGGSKSDAKNMLISIDREKLTNLQQKIYDIIMK